ncbi:MAG: alpha/beta hydrolase, partial [Pseudomonadota bacterium]
RVLANRTGCVVVALNYQKAPEHKFPVPLDDAWAALLWLNEHAEELGVDPTRIGVMGDSAGGNLATVTAMRARDEGGPTLACQILIHPVTDADMDKPSYLANAEGYMLQRGSMEAFYGHYLNDPKEGNDPHVSPLRAKHLGDLPPALVLTAEYDPLLDDGRLYARRLEAAGVTVKYSEYSGVIHGFLFMQGVLDASKRLHNEIGAWVRDVMRTR